MDIRFPTDGVKMTIVRKTTRLVGENTIKHETFGLWNGHIIKLLVGSTSLTKDQYERYVSGLNLGDQIEVEGKLQMSLVLKKVNDANFAQEESSSGNENSNHGGVPAHMRSTETENRRSSRCKPTPRRDSPASLKLTH
ncbi:hypothetical protein BG011_001013 [Mortierella polycephala]|uniref:Uncharacterized protein n=1 Tax=Mortierella polycephala TaxID=41804 RepID=A0A9P6PKL7_9FUNG|nr:hypothetical protein BG011_001013 [Mortierella polycephala]